jgi:hypothetical protein
VQWLRRADESSLVSLQSALPVRVRNRKRRRSALASSASRRDPDHTERLCTTGRAQCSQLTWPVSGGLAGAATPPAPRESLAPLRASGSRRGAQPQGVRAGSRPLCSGCEWSSSDRPNGCATSISRPFAYCMSIQFVAAPRAGRATIKRKSKPRHESDPSLFGQQRLLRAVGS